jgi:DNA-binding NtrC family response regulator
MKEITPDHLQEIIGFLDSVLVKMKKIPKVLFINNSTYQDSLIQTEFEKFDCLLTLCNSFESAGALLNDNKYDAIFWYAKPSEIYGESIFKKTNTFPKDGQFIISMGFPDSSVISNSLRKGAILCFTEPLSENILKLFFVLKHDGKE